MHHAAGARDDQHDVVGCSVHLELVTLKVAHERSDDSTSAQAMKFVTPPMRTRAAVTNTFASNSQLRVLTQLPKRHLKMCSTSVLHSVRVYTLYTSPRCFWHMLIGLGIVT